MDLPLRLLDQFTVHAGGEPSSLALPDALADGPLQARGVLRAPGAVEAAANGVAKGSQGKEGVRANHGGCSVCVWFVFGGRVAQLRLLDAQLFSSPPLLR